MNPFADLINTGGQQGQGGAPDYSQLFTEFRKQPVQQKKKKNFWLDQISTAGGILGGIGGSFIAPIAGTAGGAAAGSALGEAIEKMIDPSSTDWGNVAQEGIIGGIMGAGPIKLLKGAGAGAKALATGADDVVGVASKAALTPLRQKAGQATLGAADNLAVKSFRLTPTQLTKFQGKFGEDAGQVIRKYGFQSADDITTKGIEPLQQQFDDAITGITGVTKDSLRTNLMKRVNKLSTAGPSDTKAVGGQLKKEADNLLKGYGDVIDAKELNLIRRQFDDLVNYTEKAANPARYGVNKRMADGIRETLQQADQTGNLKNVGRELNKLRQLSDIASRQGNLGRGSLPLNLPTLLGGAAGGAAFGPAGIGTAGAVAAVNSNTGRRLAMSGAEKLGGKLAATKGGQSALGIAGRIGATGMLGGAGASGSQEDAMLDPQSLENSASNPNANPNSMAPMSASMMGEQYQTQQDLSSPFAPQNVQANVGSILQQGGDFKDVKEYLSLVDAITKIQGAGNASPYGDLSQSSRNSLASADNAINTVSQLEQLFTNAGSGSGRIGGSIKGLAARAGFDEDAKIYDSLANASVTQIAKALAGSGAGTVSDMDAKVIMAALPTLRDTPAEARAKFAALKQRLDTAKQNSMVYGGGSGQPESSSLEDAMLQYQQ